MTSSLNRMNDIDVADRWVLVRNERFFISIFWWHHFNKNDEHFAHKSNFINFKLQSKCVQANLSSHSRKIQRSVRFADTLAWNLN